MFTNNPQVVIVRPHRTNRFLWCGSIQFGARKPAEGTIGNWLACDVRHNRLCRIVPKIFGDSNRHDSALAETLDDFLTELSLGRGSSVKRRHHEAVVARPNGLVEDQFIRTLAFLWRWLIIIHHEHDVRSGAVRWQLVKLNVVP